MGYQRVSVDQMADKYPGVSPYAYCAWNPLKLVDPDGREAVDDWVKNKKQASMNGMTTQLHLIIHQMDTTILEMTMLS